MRKGQVWIQGLDIQMKIFAYENTEHTHREEKQTEEIFLFDLARSQKNIPVKVITERLSVTVFH